jgi:putative spermidine/putrescine transport system ATP-binding protein
MVRPEHIRLISEDGEDDALAQSLSGLVTDVVYLGASVRIEIELDSGTVVTVRRPPHQAPVVGTGDRINVTWAPDQAVLLGDDAQAEA